MMAKEKLEASSPRTCSSEANATIFHGTGKEKNSEKWIHRENVRSIRFVKHNISGAHAEYGESGFASIGLSGVDSFSVGVLVILGIVTADTAG
nr:hypothetical protein Iba_chr06bCG3080 [Ipomoea batatas]